MLFKHQFIEKNQYFNALVINKYCILDVKNPFKLNALGSFFSFMTQAWAQATLDRFHLH